MEKNDKTNKIFSLTKKMKRLYCVIWVKHKKFEKSKISYLLGKTLFLSIIYSKSKEKVEKEEEKAFKEEESVEILTILGLIENI